MRTQPFVTLPLVLLISVLCLLACGLPGRAQTAPTVAVSGATVFFSAGDAPIRKTDAPADFRSELAGQDVTVRIACLPPGPLTLEIGLAEIYHRAAGERVMAVTCNGQVVAPRLDIVAEAGGPDTALTKSFAARAVAGVVVLRLTGLVDYAKFGVIRVRDGAGRVLITVNADPKYKTAAPADGGTFHRLTPDQLVFFNADHSPVGAYASFVYGGKGQTGGLELANGGIPEDGVIVGLSGPDGLKVLPFIQPDAITAGPAVAYPDADVKRAMRACTDRWTLPGFSWTHYTPSFYLADIDTATAADKKRFCLPATWMAFTVDNSAGTQPRTLYFGLPVSAVQKSFVGGQFQGFAFGPHVLAVKAGSCALLTGASLQAHLTLMHQGFAFALTVPPGQRRSLSVIVASDTPDVVAPGINGRFYYTSLFPTVDDVIAYAGLHFGAARQRCNQLDAVLAKSGQNVYRQFLAGHALHSYQYSTALLIDGSGKPAWSELEGNYANNNTFDLTVDHVFYDLDMQPWAVRNVLDRFADGYAYTLPLTNPTTGQVTPGGLSFHHDMGGGRTGEVNFAPGDRPSGYENAMAFMGQEELQNWVLCAGLYWKRTRDDAWLQRRHETIAQCLASMLARDDAEPAKRDGITKFVNTSHDGKKEEITTYDSLDSSLQQSRENGYILVKNWASYLALEAMMRQEGDGAGAASAHDQAARCAKSVVAHWDPQLNAIPAIFDGRSQARMIPIVEGLVYPYEMGLTAAVSPSGPYGGMIRTLRRHLDSVLKPGICLDAQSGAWKLSSTNSNTWQSKVYLSQFVAEKVLGMTGDRISGPVDQVQAGFQVLGCPGDCWCDQLDSRNGHGLGSLHYPRGVTSALWWLDRRSAMQAPAGVPPTDH